MFQGSMCALITPMHEDGSLDYPALDQLIEFHIKSGTHAIVAMGTTGESATLNETEHCEVIRHVVDKVAGRIPVIAGTGANSTSEAIILTRCAHKGGADACLLVTPYYNKPTQEGLYLHHKAIAEAVAIPQILYNVPGRTACDMLPETVARLSKVENIVGIKEATGDMARLHKIRELCGGDFDLYSGDDETALDFILAGGQGTISVTANVAPAEMSEMCEAALAGDIDKAKAINAKIDVLHKDLFVEANPIPVKWAMAKMGFINNGIRLPMTWLSLEGQKKLGAAMQQAGVLKS